MTNNKKNYNLQTATIVQANAQDLNGIEGIPVVASSAVPTCPFANLEKPISALSNTPQCPFHAHYIPNQYRLPNHTIRLAVVGGTHQTSQAAAMLLADIGGGDRIREFCTRFYSRAFLDKIIKDFFFEEDGAEAHAKRLADWIIQKMGGEGTPWTDSGRWGMRQPSHHRAWNCEKRDPRVRGVPFKLDDARAWTRLHFWAIRECGLHEHEAFWNWYIQFMEHFLVFYERRAARYTAEDAEWSANPRNLQKYEQDGRIMLDIAGRR